jgi:cytochrome c oxidase assembly factor CtaG
MDQFHATTSGVLWLPAGLPGMHGDHNAGCRPIPLPALPCKTGLILDAEDWEMTVSDAGASHRWPGGVTPPDGATTPGGPAPGGTALDGTAPRPRRAWLAALGAALTAVSLLPPVVTAAHTYVFAESIQFVTFAMAGPALVVLGAPWRLLRLPTSRLPTSQQAALRGATSRQAAGRPAPESPATARQASFLRSAVYLLVFICVCLVWRLPPVMDALARHPALLAAELVTLFAAGTGLWLELVSSPPVKPRLPRPRLPRPQRAAVAALAMWSTWIVAYALGLSNGPVFHAYDPAGGMLSAVADQEISAALVWAVAGLCFVPVVFASMLGWLGRDDPDAELQRIARDSGQRPVVRGWGRPPRGPTAPLA